MGHHIFGHIHLVEDIHPLGEHDADHFGMFLCHLAGYSPHRYSKWFSKYESDRAKTISKQHIEEHGTASERIEKLEKQIKYLEELQEGRGL